MAKLLRLRRGTTAQHGSFTGAEGEVTVDTTKDTLVVHDNATAGGRPMLREDLNNMPNSGVTAGTYGSSSAIPAITVDAKGRITSASTSAIDRTAITNGTSNVSVAASGNITATRAGTTRLTVNSTGIDVTGTVDCDGFDSQGNGSINGNLTVNGQLTVGNGQDSSTIVMADSDNGARNIHCNSEYIGFLTQSQSWGPRADDTGHWLPGANNSHDLGSSAIQWRDGWFDGVVNCDGLTSEGDINLVTGSGVLTIKDSDSTGNAETTYVRGLDSGNNIRWHVGHTSGGNSGLYVYNVTNAEIFFGTNDTTRMLINGGGHLIPGANNTYDLGESATRWRNIYTNDLNLSNEGGANDVDGTWGSWTIQEGEDDLFLVNRRNGKKYKFNLSEVN